MLPSLLNWTQWCSSSFVSTVLKDESLGKARSGGDLCWQWKSSSSYSSCHGTFSARHLLLYLLSYIYYRYFKHSWELKKLYFQVYKINSVSINLAMLLHRSPWVLQTKCRTTNNTIYMNGHILSILNYHKNF